MCIRLFKQITNMADISNLNTLQSYIDCDSFIWFCLQDQGTVSLTIELSHCIIYLLVTRTDTGVLRHNVFVCLSVLMDCLHMLNFGLHFIFNILIKSLKFIVNSFYYLEVEGNFDFQGRIAQARCVASLSC